jgi:opacity protein-like surface antigen
MRLFITTAAAVLAVAGAASAQTAPAAKPVAQATSAQATSGQYVSVSGGLTGKTDYDYRYAGGYSFEADVDAGAQGALAWGSSLGNNWRVELGAGYRKQDVSGVLTTPAKAKFDLDGGKVETISIDINAYYDFPVAGPVKPYVGAGLGVAQVKIDDGLLDDKGDALAVNGMAGASYQVSPTVAFFAEGRLQYLGSIKLKTTSPLGDIEQKLNMTSVGGLVGVRFGF